MKAHELRELTSTEIEARLADERKALQSLSFSKSVTGQLENPARIKNHRREIARLLTVLNEKASAE
ncbi:MAG: 50S ribosomal protein L29 [Rhodobacteraceae bacterium]|nr:50S ribosomal protein L29 [Paracoccaceae bacterium]|tara:strand:- start:9993 stop:10190 length:198 start_codon:yes stop_codon:yes gene_type:complete